MSVAFRFISFALLALAGLIGLAGATAPTPQAQGRILEIEGEITPALATHLERGLERAAEAGAPVVVLEVDTPGGRVDAAIRIADALLQSPVPTVAVVRNAFSAGALVAMAAEQVVMLPGSEIGAATPVTGTGQAIEGAVGQKVTSAVRAKFRSVAQTRGRPADLAEAMVSATRAIPGLVERGEVLTLTAADAVRLKVANLQAPTLPEAARAAGFSGVRLTRVERTPAERAGAFLTQPLVAAGLLAVGVIGLLIELLSPGIAFPGIIGGLALLAYFAGSYLTGGGSSVAFLLLVAGLLLLAAELTIIPGFGLAGLAGLGSVLASIYLSFGNDFGLVAGVSVVLVGVGTALVFWLLPRSRLTRTLALSESLAGASSSPDTPELEGRIGRALSDLRPAGVADLDGKRVDVVTDGEYVAAGTPLEVVRVEGRRVLVRARRGL